MALEEARDAVQTLYVGPTVIMSGSVDGHVRTYDIRKGELRADYIGCMSFPWPLVSSLSSIAFLYYHHRPSHSHRPHY